MCNTGRAEERKCCNYQIPDCPNVCRMILSWIPHVQAEVLRTELLGAVLRLKAAVCTMTNIQSILYVMVPSKSL